MKRTINGEGNKAKIYRFDSLLGFCRDAGKVLDIGD